MTSWRAALAIAAKDLRVEYSNRAAMTAALTFGALVLVIFEMGRNPYDLTLAQSIGPSALWVASSLAGILTFNRSFAMERERGAIDGLLMAPVSRSAIYWGKYLANLIFVLLVNVVVFPLTFMFFEPPHPGHLGWVALLVGIASAGYVAVGTVFAAIAVRTRHADVLLPILMLGFLIPLVARGTAATNALLIEGIGVRRVVVDVGFLSLYAVVFMILGWILFPAITDE